MMRFASDQQGERHNPAQNLKMVEVSEPKAPSAGEALVRMEYAPIDYSDLLLANGVYFLNPKLPSVIGGEGAGIVEAIASGVNSVKIGKSRYDSISHIHLG
jgi:NADPH:quinone reductase-like Zn-dependent oxidoreductase